MSDETLIVVGVDTFDYVTREIGLQELADASNVIGIKDGRATVLKDRDGTLAAVIDNAKVVDVRPTSDQFKADGLRLKVLISQEHPSGDQVRTENDLPIRGVTKVTIEDDPESGRIVHLRMRDVAILSDDTTTKEDQ